MYCSTCGGIIVQGLSFCNHCGAKTEIAHARDANKLTEASFTTLVGGLIGIPIAGLGIVIGLISVMKKELGLSNELIIIFTSLSLFLLLAAEITFIWLLISRTRTRREVGSFQIKEAAPKSLGDAVTRELYEPTASVTENTTSPLEPVSRKPKAR